MFRFLFLIIFIAVFFESCQNNNAIKPNTKAPKDLDIIFYNINEYLENELNIGALNTSTDSIQVRIWKHYATTNYGECLLFKTTFEGQRSWLYRFWNKVYSEDELRFLKTDSLFGQIDSFRVKKCYPKENYHILTSKLVGMGILDLPAQSKIKNFIFNHSDGIDYFIEIKLGKKYSRYFYSCPDLYSTKYVECGKAVQILKYIHEVFPDFNYESCR